MKKNVKSFWFLLVKRIIPPLVLFAIGITTMFHSGTLILFLSGVLLVLLGFIALYLLL